MALPKLRPRPSPVLYCLRLAGGLRERATRAEIRWLLGTRGTVIARSKELAEGTDWGALARRLRDLLKLGPPPIGITFRDRPASGIPAFEDPMPAPTPDGRTGRVPAGCVFWMEAADKLFTTEPADHRNCTEGSLTHGLLSPEEAAQSADVAAMIETGWIPAEALGQLPSVEGRPVQVVYGPLAGATIDPDVVLIRIEAKQAMVLSDALPDARFEGKPRAISSPSPRRTERLRSA